MDSESVPALKSPSDSPRELRQIFFKAGVPMTPKEYLWPDPAASATEPPEKSSEGPPEARPSVGLGDDSSNRPAAAAAKVTPRSSELYPAVDSSGSSTKIKDPWRSSEHHPAVDSAESSAITKDSIAAPEAVATAAAAGKTTDPPGDSPDAGTQGDTPSEGEGGVLSSKAPPSGKRRYGSGLMLPRSLFRRRGRDSQSGKERGLEIESGKTVEGSLKGREVASREGKGVVGGETGEEIRAVGVSAPLTAVDLGPENSGGRAAAGEMGMEGEGSSAGERGRHAEGEVQPSRGAVGKEGEGLSADSEEGEESEENEEREKSEEGVAIAAKDNASGREGGTKGEGISEGVREGGEGRGVARAVEGRAERVEGSTGVVTLRRMKDALRNVLWPQREQREKQTHARASPGPPVDAPPSPLSHVPPKRTASLPSDTLLLHHEVPAVLVTEQPLTGMREAAMLSHPPPHTPAAAASGDAASAASAAHNPRIGGDRGKAGELPHSPPPSPVSPAPVSPSLVSPPPRSPPRLEGSTEKKKPARPRLKLPFFSPPAPTVASAAAAGGASASAARTPPCLDLSAAPSSPAAEAAEKLRERARRMGTRQQSQFEGRGEQKGKTEKEEQVEVRGRKEMEEQVAGVFTAAEWDKMSDTQGSIQHATKALKGRTSSLGSQGNRGEMGKSDEPVGVRPVLSGRELKQMEGAQAMVKSASWNLKWDAEEFKEE
ncbi:unnamed protein product [Closterium sp. Naga37s-1]|nr:unnamed protein product [Closterium sp. Naga37s-1]